MHIKSDIVFLEGRSDQTPSLRFRRSASSCSNLSSVSSRFRFALRSLNGLARILAALALLRPGEDGDARERRYDIFAFCGVVVCATCGVTAFGGDGEATSSLPMLRESLLTEVYGVLG